MPDPVVIGEARALETPEIGQAEEQAPPCAVRHYGSLGDWLGPKAGGFAAEVLELRLFECRQKFLLVVPGILQERRPPASEDGSRKSNHPGGG